MVTEIDYIGHILDESARFATCLATADRADRVPTCPKWSAADLVWHLAETQLFWGAIVRARLDAPAAAEAAKPARPDDFSALFALFGNATAALIEALTSTPGDTEVWTWAGDHSVNFVTRRQAHEALIHRLDAELVISDPSAIDQDLASDGVDEALAIMFGDVPSWGAFTPDGAAASVETSDTKAQWSLAFGRFRGTGPDTGNEYDLDSFVVMDGTGLDALFTARGNAADVDAWLWGRAPVSLLTVAGDRDVFSRFEQIVSRGVD
jgi:uncharacterized protein (TIGR03083 family)